MSKEGYVQKTKFIKLLEDLWSYELTYKRSIAIMIASFITIVYSLWGGMLANFHPEFYDGFLFRFLAVFPIVVLLLFDIERKIPLLNSRVLILCMTIAVSLNFQFLIIRNNYHEYYLVGFMVMLGLALSAFNSFSNILIFSATAILWYFWALYIEDRQDPRLNFWIGMLLTIIVGSFGYFVARMSLLIERKDHLHKLQVQYRELVNTQEKLLEKESQAIHASRLASLSEMAGGIAHEINNPLAIIQGQASLLKKMAEKNAFEEERVTKLVDKITQTTERIARIIKALMLMTSTGPEFKNKARLSLFEIIQSAAEISQNKIKETQIEFLNGNSEIGALSIDCNSDELAQVLVSLIFNSVDAIKSHEKKWIQIKVEKDVFRNGNLETQIKVCDSGSGISSSIIEKIFNPFFTTKQVGHSMGLGLSISKSIIEKSGGELWYDQKNQNTCFVISFPKSLTIS